MRSLSAFNQTVIDNPYIDTIILVEIELAGLTLYLCDRVFGSGVNECVFDGQLYEPIINSVGSSNHGALESVNYKSKAGKFSFTVNNTVTIGPAIFFSKLFLLYSFYFATVSAFQIYEGASAGDKITRFKGLIENHSDMTQAEIEITCAGPELSLPDNFVHDIVDDTTYPGAAPDDLGKMLPQVYGTAKRVPLISIDAGSITTLVTDITDVTGTITLTDSSRFPPSGTIQIDLEQITYTGNTDNNQLTGCLRGQNDTDAVSHTAGAMIGEVQSSYWYILGHAVNAINEVYVDNIRQSGNYAEYTGQTGDNDPSGLYDGKACVRFDVLPLIRKQINVDIDEGDHEHDVVSYPIYSWSLDTVVLYTGFATNFEELVDENFISGGHFYGGGGAYVSKAIGEQFGGLGPRRGRMGFVIHANPNSHNCRFYFPYLGDMYRAAVGTHRGSWMSLSSLTWTQFLAVTGLVQNYHSSDGTIAEISVFIEIEADDAGASGPATGVAITGDTIADTVIGGLIAIDVDGFQDDGAGTYTGTPDALIEQPDHIMKHVLIDRCGKVAADIDSTSYAASGAAYDTAGFILGIALLTKPNTRKLMFDIATQSRSIEFWESGTHHLIYIPATETTDKTLDSRIDIDSITIRPANRANIKNKVSATYDKEWSGKGEAESEQAVVKATSAASISKYGMLEAERLSFPYITTEAQAQAVINWMQGNQADIILLLDFFAGHHVMEIEKGDVIQFTFIADDQLDRAFLGMISTVATFRVIDVGYENENVKLSLETGTVGLTAAMSLVGFDPLGGTYHNNQSVTLASSVIGADIYYTTDGSDPDTGDTLYSTPISVTQDTTIKARLYVDGVISGSIQTEEYVLTPATPSISPAGYEFEDSEEITISCVTSGVTIRYTTDGSEPTGGSSEYTVPFEITATTTVKAKAFKSGWTPSATAAEVYTLLTVYSYAWISRYAGDLISKLVWETGSLDEAISVENTPRSMVFDGTYIWCTHYVSTKVSKIHAVTNAIQTFDVSNNGHSICFDGTNVWITHAFTGGLTRINVTTNNKDVVGLGASPKGIAFDNNSHVWVAHAGSNYVSKINVSTMNVDDTVEVGNFPEFVAFDGTYIWVSRTNDYLYKINPSTGSIVDSVDLDLGDNYIKSIVCGGGFIWAAHYSASYPPASGVEKVDVDSVEVVASILVPGGSQVRLEGMAYDGDHVWVTRYGDNKVSKINAITNNIDATYDVLNSPQDVVFS